MDNSNILLPNERFVRKFNVQPRDDISRIGIGIGIRKRAHKSQKIILLE